jgi:hypothetical protein
MFGDQRFNFCFPLHIPAEFLQRDVCMTNGRFVVNMSGALPLWLSSRSPRLSHGDLGSFAARGNLTL